MESTVRFIQVTVPDRGGKRREVFEVSGAFRCVLVAEIPRLDGYLAGFLPFQAVKTAEIPRLFRCDAGFLPVGLSVGLTGMFQRTALTSASVRYLPAAITSGA